MGTRSESTRPAPVPRRPGTVGIKQVARLAGVSPGTVSNVLNRPERVASETRTRVEEAIRELGFVRNGSASTLRAGQGRTIGLMVLDLGNPFFTDMARGVEDVVSERGYALILCSSGASPTRRSATCACWPSSGCAASWSRPWTRTRDGWICSANGASRP